MLFMHFAGLPFSWAEEINFGLEKKDIELTEEGSRQSAFLFV